MILQRVIYKKTAAAAVILCCLAIALATIWPMRLYQEDHSYASGISPVGATEVITQEQDAGEYLIAQYSHLQTLKFYVESVKEGEKATFQLFHVGENGAMELTAEEEVVLPEEVPAYAVVSVDADVTVGDTYVYTIRGLEGSRFTVGYESQTEALATGKAPLYVQGFYNDTGADDMAIKTSVLYRVPENKWSCLIRGGVYVLLGVLALVLNRGIFILLDRRKNAGGLASSSVISVRRAMQVVLTPVLAVLFAAAFAAVWPLKLFDGRLLDIVMYETGILLGAGWCMYGLWHRQDAVQVQMKFEQTASLRHAGIILCIALLMDRSASYMNATNDYIHDAATGWIVALIALITLLMAELPSLLNGPTLACFVASLIGGVVYSAEHMVSLTDSEAGWKNAAALAVGAAIVLGCTAAASVLWMTVDAAKNCRRPQNRLSKGLAGIFVILAVWMVIFRNTRLWIPLFVAVWLLFYQRYRFWKGRERFLEEICKGILLDFACKVVYCMLHRYYLAYIYSRFPMHFHTPTVTAYYLLIAAAAALTMFLRKVRMTEGWEMRSRLRAAWKEILFLGVTFSYMVMSLTRSGIGVLAVLALLAAFYQGRSGAREVQKKAPAAEGKFQDSAGRRLGRGVRMLLAMFLILCVTFPAVFTGQRIISTVYGQPRRFESLEPYDDWVLRNVDWNCTAFMNVEIFIRDFGDRILGGEIGSKIYYGSGWYIPQGYRTASAEEGERQEGTAGALAVEDLASEGELSEGVLAKLLDSLDLEALEEGSIDNGDVSNGRLGLYLAYLRHLNWTGHDEMGVTLLSGEIAVHAHNIFLQTAYDCGIPGGVLLLIAVLSILAAAVRYAVGFLRQDVRSEQGAEGRGGFELLPLLLAVGFFITGMVEWIFQFSNPYTIVLMLALAPVLIQEKGGESDNETA